MSGAISALSAPHATIDGRPFWSFGTDSNCTQQRSCALPFQSSKLGSRYNIPQLEICCSMILSFLEAILQVRCCNWQCQLKIIRWLVWACGTRAYELILRTIPALSLNMSLSSHPYWSFGTDGTYVNAHAPSPFQSSKFYKIQPTESSVDHLVSNGWMVLANHHCRVLW